jgi:hypothetical protein
MNVNHHCMQMNLSFVCYDDEEEPMLYKQNNAPDGMTKKEEATLQPLQISNGLLLSRPAAKLWPGFKSSGNKSAKKSQHMISERDFHNILQACRPRNRGEQGSGLPKSLLTLIKKSTDESANPSSSSHGDISSNRPDHASPQRRTNHHSRSYYREWGAVNFESFDARMQDDTTSQSSHSGSLASCGSNAPVFQPSGRGHLQSAISLDTLARDDNTSPDFASNEALIRQFMIEHDKSAFCHPVTKHKIGRTDAASHSPLLPSIHPSGIEAALEHYSQPKRDEQSKVAEPPALTKTVSIKDNSIIISERSLAVSPLGSLGIPYSFDSRKMRPSAVRLVVPEALPGNALRSDSLLGSRRKSFSVLHDSLREHGSMTSKTPKHNTAKISSQTPSQKQLKQIERQPSNQRRRRKQWVLNPFRQEDEDEVLAKRTHNRRRWSHVFPLGEEEFKRHAGPNWKSLCQPAILPVTIDFHPTAQELQDKEKFRVKQYSVTLPPMNETNYQSHRELLDELVVSSSCIIPFPRRHMNKTHIN